MAKKIFFSLFVAAFSAAAAEAGVFAQIPLSFGITQSLVSDFGGGVSGRITDAHGANAESLGTGVFQHNSYSGWGSGIFLDARFLQFSFGYFSATGFGGRTGGAAWGVPTDYGNAVSPTGLEFALLGKFPVEVSPRITLFPLLGVAYRLVLAGSPALPPHSGADAENRISQSPAGLSSLWFRLGGGMDLSLTGPMFLRGSFSYGVRLRNGWENSVIDAGDMLNSEVAQAGANRFTVNYDSVRLGHGVDVTIGLGFRLR